MKNLIIEEEVGEESFDDKNDLSCDYSAYCLGEEAAGGLGLNFEDMMKEN